MKNKILVIGCNPSVKSPDNTAFHPSTRSRMTIDRWLSDLDADVCFMNIYDRKTRGNRPLTRKELKSLEDPVFFRLKSFKNHKIITLGRAAEEVLTSLGLSFLAIPHPSGLNRQLNDPEFMGEKIKRLREYLSR